MKRNILISTNEGWANGSWSQLESSKEVEIYRDVYGDYKGIKKIFLKIVCSHKLEKFGFGYLQFFLMRHFIDKIGINGNDDIAILVYHISGGDRLKYLYKYLKRKYPNIKIGYLFTNVVSKVYGEHINITNEIERLKGTFDKVYAFDRRDSQNYSIQFSYLVYNPILQNSNNIKYDVFLVAKAKDRFKDILDIYHKCSDEMLITDFYVNEISKSDLSTLKEEKIHANQVLSYDDVVKELLSSRCIIDIMQKESTGITLNVCEAVVYNKKIITNNPNIKEEPFYSSDMIYILNERKDSLREFIYKPTSNYPKNSKDLFSGNRLFDNLRGNL